MNAKLFGWVGEPDPTFNAERFGDNAGHSTSEWRTLGGDGWALAVAREQGHRSGLTREGSLAVAIVGDVHWRDAALAATASQQGAAAAVRDGYARCGESLLERMSGSFALAVLDLDRRKSLLAIDRMGIETLCYASSAGRLMFGSTTDLVIADPRVPREISAQAIYNYLYCHMVPSPGTIYTGMSKLRPAECVSWSGGSAQTRFWWRLRYQANGAGYAELASEFRTLLCAAVGESLRDEKDIGAFLSGGTDSSTVAGLVSELRPPADTYSIGFDAQGFDEMEYARITSRHFGTRAHEYYVTPQDVVDIIPRIAEAYDEPFGNASAVPTYYCARAARQDGKTVMLAGDGGDEIFGGNARYAKQKIFEWYWQLPAALRHIILDPLATSNAALSRVPPLRKLRSYAQQARVRLPDRLESYNFLEREPLDNVLDRDFAAKIDFAQPRAIAQEAYDRAASTSAIDCMMHLDLKQTLADSDLRKVTGMCHLAGIDVRYPLLHDDLVEFSGRLPASYKVRGLTLRWFFKKALSDFLPRQTIRKTKHGFGLPFGLWLQKHPGLQQLTGDSLTSLRRRRIINDSYIDRLLTLHRGESATYYGVMIWVLMLLEQWLQKHDA